MIGEQFGTKSDTVAGIVLNLKPQFDKVAIWLTDYENEEETGTVKKELMQLLALEEKDLEYQVFNAEGDSPGLKEGGRGRGGWNRGGFERGRGRGRGF